MPTYDYQCAANGVVYEVKHGINHRVSTWSELCELAGRDLGDTPADAPVNKLISASAVHTPTIGEWKKTKPAASGGHVHSSACGCGH